MKTSALDIEEIMSKPEGSKCVCDPATWDSHRPTPQICGKFVPGTVFKDGRMCDNCLHDEACHAAPKVQEADQ